MLPLMKYRKFKDDTSKSYAVGVQTYSWSVTLSCRRPIKTLITAEVYYVQRLYVHATDTHIKEQFPEQNRSLGGQKKAFRQRPSPR